MTTASRPQASSWGPFVDSTILGLTAALVVLTLVIVVAPDVAPAVVSERLDLVTVTGSLLVAGAVAALQWARGRVGGDMAALLRGSSFAALGTVNSLILLVLLLGVEDAVGGSLDDPGQIPLLVPLLGRAVAAALLVVAGIGFLRARAVTLPPAILLLGPMMLVLAIGGLAVVAGDRLPELASQEALDRLAADPTSVLDPASAPVFVILQALVGAGFLTAALLAYRSFRRSGRLGEGLIACGLVVAAFSQIHAAIHPGTYAGLITTADMLRLGFHGFLLAGIIVDNRDDLRALRQANVDLRRLGDAELATAALEERARLAREIHDGLAQDLWYAKLKHSRLVQQAGLVGEARTLGEDVETAIDAALAEARHAVSAMRDGAHAGNLTDALERHVDDFADRFALRAELEIDGAIPDLGPRVQAEVLRIVQEAMTNARRHADATVVRVRVASGVDLRIAIADNGRGFHPDAVVPGFGLESMRQRASLIGASLHVTSEPHAGTRVELVIPDVTVARAGAEEREGSDGG